MYRADSGLISAPQSFKKGVSAGFQVIWTLEHLSCPALEFNGTGLVSLQLINHKWHEIEANNMSEYISQIQAAFCSTKFQKRESAMHTFR